MLYNPRPPISNDGGVYFINVKDFLNEYGEFAINEAIKYAFQKGISDVFVPSGNYVQNYFNLLEHINLYGEGFGSKITYKKDGGRNNFINAYELSTFSIKNLWLDMNNQLGEGVYGSGELLDVDDCTGGLIEGLYTTNSTQDDIDLDNSSGITVKHCVSYKAGKSGIHVSHNCKDNLIFNNYVTKAGQTAKARGGITQVNNSYNNIYYNNTVVDCWRNYDIRLTEDGKPAIWGYNISEGGQEPDEINTPLDYNTEG